MPRVLLLAQLPPPVHGVTVTTARVRDVLSALPGFEFEHLWAGSAGDLGDVDRRDLGKLAGFAGLNAQLAKRASIGPRADIAYLTLAPWTHAALRDTLVAWWGKRVARRTLVHLHGEGLDKLLARTDRMAMAMRGMLAGTELIAITGRAAETARKSGVFSRVWRLPNCAADPGEPVIAPLADGRPLRIGFLGNLDPRKGVLRLLDVMTLLKAEGHSVEARIAGGGTQHLTVDGLRAAVEARGLAGVVRIDGPVTGTTKMQFLEGLDVFLYPSLHDHAPLVVIEAMSHGLAPIAIDTGGVAELLGPGLGHNLLSGGTSESEAVSGAVGRLAGYLADPARLARDRQAARHRYLDAYTEERFTSALREIVQADAITGSTRLRIRSGLPATIKAPAVATVRRVHAAFARRDLPDRVAVYFHALDDGERKALSACVAALRGEGYAFVGMDAYVDPGRVGRLANISFDDNYRCWHDALPLFDRLGLRATFYVNTLPFRDTCNPAEIERYYDRLEYRGSRIPLSSAELQEIARAGHEIGCHSHSHAILSTVPEHRWDGEIKSSKELLEDVIAMPVRHFSWPYGMQRHITRPLQDYCLAQGFVSLAAGTPGLLHMGPWDRSNVPRTGWRADRPDAENLTDLAIDGALFTRFTGRSALG